MSGRYIRPKSCLFCRQNLFVPMKFYSHNNSNYNLTIFILFSFYFTCASDFYFVCENHPSAPSFPHSRTLFLRSHFLMFTLLYFFIFFIRVFPSPSALCLNKKKIKRLLFYYFVVYWRKIKASFFYIHRQMAFISEYVWYYPLSFEYKQINKL